MVDVQTVSIAIASASVVAGVVYYALQIRHQTRVRQTDLVVRLYSLWTGGDFLEAMLKVANLDYEDYTDFLRKYGPLSSETPVNIAFFKVANYFDELGILLHKGLIDADMVSEFLMPSTLITWNKMKPAIEGFRKDTGRAFYHWFEYFYDETKKREPEPQSEA